MKRFTFFDEETQEEGASLLLTQSSSIVQQYCWVGRLINAGHITAKKAASYSKETLEILNHRGVFNLMDISPPLLTLEKALTLSPNQANGLDDPKVYMEIVGETATLDEVLQRYAPSSECTLK